MLTELPSTRTRDTLMTERHDHDVVERVRFPLAKLEMQDPALWELYQHWNSLRRDGILPNRNDIDPLHLKPYLGRLHMVDTSSESPENYWFRLYGSRIILDGGRDYSKLHLKDYPHEAFRRAVTQDYWDAVSSGVASYHRVAAYQNYLTYTYSRLILPLTNETVAINRVSHLLVYIHSDGQVSQH